MTPAVVIDGVVKASGRIPSRNERTKHYFQAPIKTELYPNFFKGSSTVTSIQIADGKPFLKNKSFTKINLHDSRGCT